MASSLLKFINKHKAVIIVAGLAFVVRAIYLLELSTAPGFGNPMIDEKWHWEWASEILAGPFLGTGAWFRAPLYPYFLALLSFITGGSIFWSKLLQLLLTAGTATFIFLTAEKLFNRRAAVIAGVIYAVYGTFLYYETMFLIPVLFVFLLTWGMYRLIAGKYGSVKSLLFTGLIFGLASIARPNVLVVIPVLMVWLWFVVRKTLTPGRAAARVLLLAAGVAIAIIPVTVRNAIKTGQFILISSQGGINLYLGNNPQANGLNMLMPDVKLDATTSWRDFIPMTTQVAEQAVGHDLNDAQVSSYWTSKAIDFILHHPGSFIGLAWKKLVYLAMGFENSDNLDIYHQRGFSHLYQVLLWKIDGVLYFPYGLLLPLAIMGVSVLRKKWRQMLPLYLFIVAYIPTIILFLVTARHRLPILPFLIIIAGGGIAYMTAHWKKMAGSTRALSIVVPLALIFLFNHTYYAAGATNDFQNFYNDGLRFANLGDYANAEVAFSQAYQLDPQSVPLLDNLAYSQFQIGEFESAKRNFQRAITLNPHYARALNNFGLLILREGKADSAAMLFNEAIRDFANEPIADATLSQVYLNLGDAYDRLGDTANATATYQRAIEIAPDFAKAYFETSSYFARRARYDLADSTFQHGLEHGDARAVDHFNYGLSLLRRKKLQTGVTQMKTVLDKDPKFYQAAFCVAAAYHDLGAPVDSSLKYVQMSLELNPQYQPAIKLLNTINGNKP